MLFKFKNIIILFCTLLLNINSVYAQYFNYNELIFNEIKFDDNSIDICKSKYSLIEF